MNAQNHLCKLLLAGIMLLPVQGTAAEITLRIHHFLSEASLPHTSLIEPWARQVEADSNGRINVEIYPDMSLGGKTGELVDQAGSGAVDIIWTAAAYTPERFPRAEVFTLPLVHDGNPAATNQAIMSATGSWLAPNFEGLKPLLVHVQAGHSFHLSYKTVNNLSDLSGLTMRPAGRRIGLWTIEALGAGPSKKRHPKLSKALEQSELDGALMSFQLARALDVVAAAKSHTMLGENQYFGTSLYLFLMNRARFEALPADLRKVIEQNSGLELARSAGQIWQDAEQQAIAAARELGNDIIVLGGEERKQVENALEAVLLRWSESVKPRGVDGPQLIQKARRAISRYQEE